MVGFDQLFLTPSKPSNVQIDEGLFQTKLILKAILNRFDRLDRLTLKKDFGLGGLCGLEAAGGS